MNRRPELMCKLFIISGGFAGIRIGDAARFNVYSQSLRELFFYVYSYLVLRRNDVFHCGSRKLFVFESTQRFSIYHYEIIFNQKSLLFRAIESAIDN